MKRWEKNIVGACFFVLVLAVIPLIVSAKKYHTGMEEFSWFSNTITTYDFFLYWKNQALIVLCGMLSAYVSAKILITGIEVSGTWKMSYVIPLAIYAGMVGLSGIFSEYPAMALWGGYEQWEGTIILEVYVILLCMSYALVKGETEMRIIAYGLFAGVTGMAVLGFFQGIGMDFFRTESGQHILNLMSAKKLKFSFNFEPGRIYATLYNPNYVGSYVALVLPIVLSFVAFQRKLWTWIQNGIAAVVVLLLIIMLLGSQSVTGFIGVMAVGVWSVIFLLCQRKKNRKQAVVVALVCVIALSFVVGNNMEMFRYGWNKIVNPTSNRAFITAMESREGKLWITTTHSDVLKFSVEERGFCAEDENGKTLSIVENSQNSQYYVEDERFEEIKFQETFVLAQGREYAAVAVMTPATGRSYTVVPTEKEPTEYQMYNPFEKLDTISYIPRIGFEKNQHFGSRRGYIWSRTFPLLKENLLLGSGANTFAMEFPNHDYVGMKNVGYDGAIVTKPHNMYLQIWVQTGLVSLLAFLALYLIYFVDCIKQYWNLQRYDFVSRFGVGIWFGTFGYMVTGLANDSSVCVAPLYWCLLGVGMAVNRYAGSKRAEEREEKKEGCV